MIFGGGGGGGSGDGGGGGGGGGKPLHSVITLQISCKSSPSFSLFIWTTLNSQNQLFGC